MRFLKQITALLLSLQVSFCKELDDTAKQGPASARNGVTHNKMIFYHPDFTTEPEEIYAENTISEEQEEKLMYFLADDVSYNVNSNYVSLRRMNSLQRFVKNTVEHQDDTLMRLYDAFTDLELQVNSRAKGDKCQWDEYIPDCLRAGCHEALKNGVYNISPNVTNTTSFHVYCLEDDCGGDVWTVIQRRLNGKVHFNRTWHQYKLGFGALDDNSELWLGLDHIYTLTNSDKHELRITLTNWDNQVYVAYYDHFSISDEASNFTLNSTGQYTGNVTSSSLEKLVGLMWSTKDRAVEESCAGLLQNGWWHGDCSDCGAIDLNREYPAEDKKMEEFGIYWQSIQNYSFKASEMAIRIIK